MFTGFIIFDEFVEWEKYIVDIKNFLIRGGSNYFAGFWEFLKKSFLNIEILEFTRGSSTFHVFSVKIPDATRPLLASAITIETFSKCFKGDDKLEKLHFRTKV